jgi:putative transposase
MKILYDILGISKQAHWKYMVSFMIFQQKKDLISRSMIHLRQLHPKMGAKKMYTVLDPDCLGRDAFIELYCEYELRLKKERSYTRTTYSLPSSKYTNLTVNRIFVDIDELWSSDITYFSIGVNIFLYITFIIDVYSRMILGYCVSQDLSAKACVKALGMALNFRNKRSYNNLIHHSDKGTQYTSNAYTGLLTKYNIKISMCDSVYENTHIERVNGIIKNEYLAHMNIKSLAECQRTLNKAVKLYNTVRPHWSLGGLTPEAFEKNLKTIPYSERFHLEIFHDKERVNCQNVKQIELEF